MEDQIIQTNANLETYHSDDKAAIDVQIATAKAYPRDIDRAVSNSIAIATMDKSTAETCSYSLPRGTKKINGPSVHLARMIAQSWQNLRIESRISEITSTQVVSHSVCFDLENNYAVKVEVRRSIMQSVWEHGKKTTKKERMNDDMITVTGNAANAIAYRNAVFAVIPQAVTNKVSEAAKTKITGDLTSEVALSKRRNMAFLYFKTNYNITEAQILSVFGLQNINQFKQDEIVSLLGLQQAIKDGDTSVKDTFLSKPRTMENRKTDLSNNSAKPKMP